jgi:phospholipase D1/2
LALVIQDPSKYIKFFGLRTHGMLPNGKPATEIVYVHSKMMIVDDKVALIGSANINDRSMMGSRDSELAVVVEDTKKVESKMGCNWYVANDFSHSLRVRCFQQIFGFTDPKEVSDPLDPQMWVEIHKRVSINTAVYREVFGCYPDNLARVTSDTTTLIERADPSKYSDLSKDIKGLAVEFPLDFLSGEDLRTMKHFEFGLLIVPNYVFT